MAPPTFHYKTTLPSHFYRTNLLDSSITLYSIIMDVFEKCINIDCSTECVLFWWQHKKCTHGKYFDNNCNERCYDLWQSHQKCNHNRCERTDSLLQYNCPSNSPEEKRNENLCDGFVFNVNKNYIPDTYTRVRWKKYYTLPLFLDRAMKIMEIMVDVMTNATIYTTTVNFVVINL